MPYVSRSGLSRTGLQPDNSVHACVEGTDGLDNHVGDVAEEARVDSVCGVGWLVVITVVFHAKVDERHSRIMEGPVIG